MLVHFFRGGVQIFDSGHLGHFFVARRRNLASLGVWQIDTVKIDLSRVLTTRGNLEISRNFINSEKLRELRINTGNFSDAVSVLQRETHNKP